VQQFEATVPATSPLNGQSWALGTAPTGVWAGHGGQIASYVGDGWYFITPGPGWRAWGLAEGALKVWGGATWNPVGLDASNLNNLPGIGVGAASDPTNRLTVSAPATLLNHAGGGHQVKVNKASAGDTASLLYQNAFSGRAEMGLAGTDDFSVKVSATGGTWRTALTAVAATGGVQLHHFALLVPGTAPAAPARGTVYYDDDAGMCCAALTGRFGGTCSKGCDPWRGSKGALPPGCAVPRGIFDQKKPKKTISG
jgi:hypothetical protein